MERICDTFVSDARDLLKQGNKTSTPMFLLYHGLCNLLLHIIEHNGRTVPSVYSLQGYYIAANSVLMNKIPQYLLDELGAWKHVPSVTNSVPVASISVIHEALEVYDKIREELS